MAVLCVSEATRSDSNFPVFRPSDEGGEAGEHACESDTRHRDLDVPRQRYIDQYHGAEGDCDADGSQSEKTIEAHDVNSVR